MDLSAAVRGDEVAVRARPRLDGPAAPVALVARRAGDVRRARLQGSGRLFIGRIALPATGRWFVYIEAREGRRPVESWLPVKVGEDEATKRELGRFAYFSDRKSATAVKYAVGAAIYAFVLAFLAAVVVVARDARRQGKLPQAT